MKASEIKIGEDYRYCERGNLLARDFPNRRDETEKRVRVVEIRKIPPVLGHRAKSEALYMRRVVVQEVNDDGSLGDRFDAHVNEIECLWAEHLAEAARSEAFEQEQAQRAAADHARARKIVEGLKRIGLDLDAFYHHVHEAWKGEHARAVAGCLKATIDLENMLRNPDVDDPKNFAAALEKLATGMIEIDARGCAVRVYDVDGKCVFASGAEWSGRVEIEPAE